MKIAFLSDVHGNYRALEAVVADVDAFRPDRVVVVGDIINRGPRSRECWDFIQARCRDQGWQIVRGNHEEYVAANADRPWEPTKPADQIRQTSWWTFQFFKADWRSLTELPFQVELADPQQGRVLCTHASLRGTRDGVYSQTTDEIVRAQMGPKPPALLVVGHTHRCLERHVDQTRIINTGSVGLPFDGDPRPGYVQAVWRSSEWHLAFVRLDYDRDAAAADFETTGFAREGGALVELMQAELRTARSHIGEWTKAYEARVLDGSITIEESVRRFLDQFTVS